MTATRPNPSALTLQWAKANLPAPDKDEDSVVLLPLGASSRLLVGVADGITRSNGRLAARWVADTLYDLSQHSDSGSWSCRDWYARLTTLLKQRSAQDFVESRSTLTCGLVSAINTQQGTQLRFDFFAVGDSPVWVVRALEFGPLRYQASIVHDAPVPSEMSALYSWLDLGERRFVGRVHFGSVELEPDDLLMVMTDGIPEQTLLMSDQEDGGRLSPQLLSTLMDSGELSDNELERLLRDYEQQHLLLDDDVSLAVVRLCTSVKPIDHCDHQSMTVDVRAESSNPGICRARSPEQLARHMHRPKRKSSKPQRRGTRRRQSSKR